MELLNKTSLLFCILFFPYTIRAQEDAKETGISVIDTLAPGERPKPTQYIPTEEERLRQTKQTFFQGFSVSVDALGAGMYLLSDYGNLEASLRLNLLNTYFPVAEVGMGRYDKTDYNTNIHFSTNAPYIRLGCDLNILKNKWQTNKLFVGFRYGLTNFNYSIDGPEQRDPIWDIKQPLNIESVNATSHFLEIVLGCQVKVLKGFHMGWSIRYKKELATSKSIYSHPVYIPGYGTTVNSSNWGVTYNLSFDLNWGKKKPTIKEIIKNTTTVNDARPKEEENKSVNDTELSE